MDVDFEAYLMRSHGDHYALVAHHIQHVLPRPQSESPDYESHLNALIDVMATADLHAIDRDTVEFELDARTIAAVRAVARKARRDARECGLGRLELDPLYVEVLKAAPAYAVKIRRAWLRFDDEITFLVQTGYLGRMQHMKMPGAAHSPY